MADAYPASLKALKPYLLRADELEAVRPLASYYCNLYALQRGIRERDPADEDAARFIKSLLKKCEGLRSHFAADADSHRGQLEEFALSVFDRADADYRSGAATNATAQHFYAAMCFFDVCTHFGPLTEDLAATRLRARKYAALIARDVRDGKTPVPPDAPPPAEAEEAALAAELAKSSIPPAPPVDTYAPNGGRAAAITSTTASTMYGGRASPASSTPSPPPPPAARAPSPPPSLPLPPPPSLPLPLPPTPPPAASYPAPPAAPFAAPPAARPAAAAAVPGYKPDARAIGEAQRQAKFAVSSLNFQDIKTAISNLSTALALLTGAAAAPP